MKRFSIISALFFLFFFLCWTLFAVHYFTVRIPRNWSFQAEYIGNLLWADEHGLLQEKKNLNLYQRYWKVLEGGGYSDSAVIEDIYRTIDVQSGEVTWETTLQFNIDPRNGKIIAYKNHPEAKGLYYIFPQNVEQKDYTFFNFDLNPFTMKYQRTEILDGMELYVFSYKGMLDYTELFNMAQMTPTVYPGAQKIISYDFYRELWVEPITGELVNIIEDDKGDYLVQPTKEKKTLYCVWSGKTTGNTVRYLTDRAQRRLWQLQVYRRWFPGVLLLCSLTFMTIALVIHFRSKRRIG